MLDCYCLYKLTHKLNVAVNIYRWAGSHHTKVQLCKHREGVRERERERERERGRGRGRGREREREREGEREREREREKGRERKRGGRGRAKANKRKVFTKVLVMTRCIM